LEWIVPDNTAKETKAKKKKLFIAYNASHNAQINSLSGNQTEFYTLRQVHEEVLLEKPSRHHASKEVPLAEGKG
jgi:hypothetical protein